MDKQEQQNWFEHTADLIVEHIDKLDGQIRIYYLSSMADQKYIRQELLPKLKQVELTSTTIEIVEQVVGISIEQRVFVFSGF